jgi:hypothetical protein
MENISAAAFSGNTTFIFKDPIRFDKFNLILINPYNLQPIKPLAYA